MVEGIKINVLYVIHQGCPFCIDAKKAVLEVNNRLPFDERIEIVDIFSGDNRVKFLEKLFGTKSRYDWYVPLLVVDKPKLIQMYNSTLKGRGYKTYIFAIRGKEHYASMLLRYLT